MARQPMSVRWNSFVHRTFATPAYALRCASETDSPSAATHSTRPLALTTRAFWGLAFDVLACAPFAINIVRRLSLAHGLAEYDALECARLMGRQSADHAEILGYAPRSAVVHRDQMVVL